MSFASRTPLLSSGRAALMGLGLLLVMGVPLDAQVQGGNAFPKKVKNPGYTLKAENQADGSILVTYELTAEPQIRTVVKQGQVFSHFKNLDGFVVGGEKGFPETLSKQANLMVDPNQDYGLEMVDSQFREISFGHPYLPSRGTILRNQNPDKVPYELAPESLRGGMYPAAVVEHGEGYFIRNVAGYNLRFAIAQIDNGSRRAHVYTRMVFKLKPIGMRKSVVDQDAPESRKVVKEVYDVMQGMFLNAPPAPGPQSLSRAPWSYEVGDQGEILVIHTSRDASAIQPWIDHKKANGWTVSTQQVAAGTNVKTTVQNAYNANKNILYVQLVGDWADLQCDTTTSTGETCAIDNALGLVSGSDNYFDLIIGRFSGESSAHITTQVNKAIAYEKAGDQAWKKKGLNMASNEGAGSGDDNESDIQHNDVIKTNKLLAKGFTSIATAYDSPSTAPLSACTSPVNNGLGVINYTGHGLHTSWATTGMSSSNVANLTNGGMTPIIFSVACVVGQYNTQTSFAEAWLRKDNGGAVAAIMSTIYQPWLPPMRGQDYMNDLLTGGYNYTNNPGDGTNTDHGKSTLGSIAMNAFNLMLGESQDSDSIQTTQSWVLFGDATLRVTPGTVTNTKPTITTQPVNKTVTAGQTATFSVVASGTSPLNYQWYKNNGIIDGATSASYTTPATTTGDSGATFHVIVSNSLGSATSNTATLTVNAAPPTTSYNEVEANNTTATANIVADNVTKIVGYIGSSTDSDYFKLNVGAGKNLKVVMSGPTGTNYDYDLYFYNSAGTQIASGTTSTTSETVNWTNTGTGTVSVYVAVKRYLGSSTTTPYNLSITR